MLVGPAMMSLLAVFLVEKHRGWWSPLSILFLTLLGGVLLSRWVDPIDSQGQPSTPRQRQLELAFLVVLGAVGWVVANALGASWKK